MSRMLCEAFRKLSKSGCGRVQRMKYTLQSAHLLKILKILHQGGVCLILSIREFKSVFGKGIVGIKMQNEIIGNVS